MDKLNKIVEAHLEGIVKFYEGESRSWMDEICEDDIYREMETGEFKAFEALVLGNACDLVA